MPLREKATRLGVPVSSRPIREAILFGNRLGTGPVDKFTFDLFAKFMSAACAVPTIPSKRD